MKLVSYNSACIYLAYDIKYISWKLDVKICCKYKTVGILHGVEKKAFWKQVWINKIVKKISVYDDLHSIGPRP